MSDSLQTLAARLERTALLDELRAREFRRLDEAGHVYLDYTGGGLYPDRLVREHAQLLLSMVLGNPHSQNPTSLESTRLVEQARQDVLRYFQADPDEYLVIFTANASAALKLIGESYPFGPGARFVLLADNHNSVHGIREFARQRGASIDYIPLDPLTLRAPGIEPHLEADLQANPRLFAFPAQSNFSGVQHPLEWIELAHDYGYDVLLDAAAFVPSNRLDLGVVHPDFVPISFYKMFGYPTGVGALLARRQTLAKCRRPWFGGGTVKIVSTKADLHILAEDHEAFEDGTLNYLNLPAISRGLAFMQEIGIDTIHERVEALVSYVLEAMLRLRHDNGKAVDSYRRGCTVAFNVLDVHGDYVPFQQVEAEANQQRISIRAGCFCNPGAGEYSLTHSRDDVLRCVAEATTNGHFDIDHYHACLADKAKGAVRLSVGMVSNQQDIERFLAFLATFRNREASAVFTHASC